MIDKFAYRLDKLENNCSNYLNFFSLYVVTTIYAHKTACKLLLFASNNVIGLCLHSNYSGLCQINNIISKLFHLNNDSSSSSEKRIRRSNRKGNWKCLDYLKSALTSFVMRDCHMHLIGHMFYTACYFFPFTFWMKTKQKNRTLIESDSFFPFNHLSCIDIFQMLCMRKKIIIIVNYLKVTTTYFFTHYNRCAALFTIKCLNNFKFNY